MKKKQSSNKFEQIFLTEAFGYSITDDVENADKMLRVLRGLLSQEKIRKRFNTKQYEETLDKIEKQPVQSINKDIYTICTLLRNDTSEVTLWKKGRPTKTIQKKEIQEEMRKAMNQLTAITGRLCEIMDVTPLIGSTRKFDWRTTKTTGGDGEGE